MIINAGCVQAGGNVRAIAWAGVSIFTLAAAIGAAPSPALAACDATAPQTGDTVTCGAGSPNPESDPIIAPDAKGVTINFGEDAELRTLGSPSVQLGGGAYIYMRPGSLIADHNRIAGPSPSDATIDLGLTSNDALQTAIHETTAKVTVNKAKMADRAMNAITDFIVSSVIVPPPPASGEVDGVNRVDVGGGRIISDGAAAIRSVENSALSVSISDGGSVETIRTNAPAILLDGTGSLAVELDNGAIVAHRRGSPAISAASGDSALDVLMYDDARIHTVGDNSPAIMGPGANSVFNFEADGSGATEGRPMIATYGDNSAGILMHGAGGSTATVQFDDISSSNGPGLQTSGDNSALVDMDLGDTSSLNVAGANTSFGTRGDGSGVFDLSVGDSSDLLLLLQNSTLISKGDDAALLDVTRGSSSILNAVVLDSAFQTSGDGSGGLVFHVDGGDTSTDNYYLDGVTIYTRGHDAPAFYVEDGGDSSLRTVAIIDSTFETQGSGSPAVTVGGMGESSASELTVTDTSIATQGDSSDGLFFGGAGASSAVTANLTNVDISTVGDDSAAATLLGVANDSSVAVFSVVDSTLTTEGDNSVGLLAVPLSGSTGNSTGVISLENLTVSTLGAGSTGVIIGDASLYDGPLPTVPDTTVDYDLNNVTVSTDGNDADGVVVYGLGAGGPNMEASVSFENVAANTTGDNSRGIVVHSPGGPMTATLSFADLTPQSGPALSTEGDNATLIDVDLGDESSINLSAENTSFGTHGDNSEVVSLHVGDSSDVLFFAEGASFASEGDEATLLEIRRGSNSIMNVTALNTTFETVGDGSGGLVFRVNEGDMSTDTHFLDNVTIETQGNDAPAFYLEDGGNSSVRVTQFFNSSISTSGANSGGVHIGELGQDSAIEVAIGDMTTFTQGDNSTGIFVGGSGGDSVKSLVIFNLTVSTFGNDSSALISLGVDNDMSLSGIEIIDSTFTTEGDNSVGLLAVPLSGATGGSTGVVSLENLTVSTLGAGSTGVIIGDASLYDGPVPTVPDTTVNYDLNNVTVSTTGNDADGVVVYGLGAGGPNTEASVSFENVAANTTGDNSRGIVVHSPGGPMTATLSFADLTPQSGPALSTEGDNATLIDVDLGDESSINLSAENTSFGTHGDSSEVVSLHVGDSSDVLFFAEGTSFASGGDDATLLDVTRGSSSILNAVVLDSAFQASGDGSGGLVFQVDDGETSSDSYFLENVTINTQGDDAPALHVEDGGFDSVRTVDLFDSNLTTQGNNSAGLYIGSLGALSASSFTLNATTIATHGDDSPGLFHGGVESGSTSLELSNLDISTVGDNSNAATHIGVRADNSIAAFDALNLTLSTQGDNSAGLMIVPVLAGLSPSATSGSTFVSSLTSVSVSTSGSGSAGVILGDAGFYGVSPSTASNSTFTNDMDFVSVETTGDDADGVIIHGLGVDSTDISSNLLLDNMDVTTSGDRSRGIVVNFGSQVEGSDSLTILDEIEITTTGDEAHGLVLGEGLGTELPGVDMDNTLAIGDVSVSTEGMNAHALVIGKNTTLTLDGVANQGATTANHTIVNGFINSFDNLVATGEGGRAVHNEGILYGTFTVSDPVVGNLSNNGLIESADGAVGVAVQYTGATDDIFELQPMGVVIGSVEAGDGEDRFLLGGEGEQTFDVALIGTQYNDFEIFGKEDASVWTLTGTNAVAGPFTVAGGTLVNNAMLANMAMTVGPDGRLEGDGTVGGLVIDGTVAPGNSVGVINVAGDVVFNAGSVYEVEIAAPDEADLIAATGTATINGGALDIVALDSEASYADGETYRIVEAEAGVIRNADFLYNQPFSLIRADVLYGADYVDLMLVADIPFTSLANTYNQFQAASGLQNMAQTGDALTVFNEIVKLSLAPNGVEAVRQAFDVSSGEIHASAQHVINQTFSQFSRLLRQQGAAGVMNTGLTDTMTATHGFGKDASANASAGQAWLAPLGGGGSIDSDGNAATLDWWSAGIAGGYENSLDVARGQAFAGFGLGYTRSSATVDARLSSMEADNFQIGVYGGWANGPWSLSGSLAYLGSSVSTTRQIAFGDINRRAETDYWTNTFGFSGEAAYGFAIAAGTTLSPIATVDAGWSGHGDFSETGAGALNLTGLSESWTQFDIGLGLALQHTMPTGAGDVTFEVRALWEYAFADVVPTQTMVFEGSPTAFSVLGPDAGRNRFRLGAGVAVPVSDSFKVRANYDGLFNSEQQNHAASISLNLAF
nr:autotransporter domain-containing protein [Flavimaribacter sediminis]